MLQGPPHAGLIGNPVSVDKFDVWAQRQLLEDSRELQRQGIAERAEEERRARVEREEQLEQDTQSLHELQLLGLDTSPVRLCPGGGKPRHLSPLLSTLNPQPLNLQPSTLNS